MSSSFRPSDPLDSGVVSPFDLPTTLRQLATRNPGRSEADLQAQIRDVLLYGGFDLGDEAVLLESPADDRRRLDIEVGAVIIECKRDLRPPTQLASAERQVGDYLAGKAARKQLYAGVLTDGATWLLYRHRDDGPQLVDEFRVSPAATDDRAFRWWLGAVLATDHAMAPTASAIEERLGAAGPSYQLVTAALLECWVAASRSPGVRLKRDLWSKLLRSALGSQFEESDGLFIDHTYLVLLATLIGHAVAGFDVASMREEPGVLISGQLFERAGLLGVGQAGFFDWVLDSPSGAEVVTDIARRISAFDWTNVKHDVLKVLYQSVIAQDVRKRLGEYYTPDWLAERMLEQVAPEPLHCRVLDPSCGSGTFIFHAVRRHLAAADGAGMDASAGLASVTESVFGMDLHPVAVALAQTTYLLAIGKDRLAARVDSLNIPVYLGDSMRWEAAEEGVFTSTGDVVLHATGQAQTQLFGPEIRFPADVVRDVGRFDHLVNDLTGKASNREPGSPRPPVGGLLTRLGVSGKDRITVEATYNVLCDLHDAGLNHIWGYYVRNQSRPTWLARSENRVDVLVGNPPWLAYRFMPETLKRIYQKRAKEMNLWLGGGQGRTTQQDLSAYFVARCVELYLRPGGSFAFVMPRAVLSRQTYAGFRAGDYSSASAECYVAFDVAWDLENVRPDPFPVPSAVTFGRRSPTPRKLSNEVLELRGSSPKEGDDGTLSTASATITVVTGEEPASPYKSRFRQGAILVPRMLTMVTGGPDSPLGVQTGRRAVRSRKTSLDKEPWKSLPEHQGAVESIFVRPAFLGESIAPFRILTAYEAVIPFDGTQLMSGDSERLDRYPGLADWWRRAEAIWLSNRSSEKRTLLEQLDYLHQLSAQFPVAPWRVVYTKAGNTLAAATINDTSAVIDHMLYWAPAHSPAEARYLTSILNAPVLGEIVRPYQSVGAFGARHFDKYVWQAPIPQFDSDNPEHIRIASTAEAAEKVAMHVQLPADVGFQKARKLIRAELEMSDVGRELDELVRTLLAPRPVLSMQASSAVG